MQLNRKLTTTLKRYDTDAMPKSRLTFTVDPSVVARARRYAKQRGISLSKMVEGYLGAVTAVPPALRDMPPVLRSLRGILKKADSEDHKKHLARKYR